jgi:predicted O-methyltransferase YrrM
MVKDGVRPFDFIFIDADKTGYPAYLDQAVKLSWPGTVIVADNMVRQGAVADAGSEDEAVKAVRLFNEKLAADKRLSATAMQTVGVKGYDGFVLARVGS